MNESAPLLKDTLRLTALIMLPVAAFLAALSVVALMAIPSGKAAVPASSDPDKVTDTSSSIGVHGPALKPQNKI